MRLLAVLLFMALLAAPVAAQAEAEYGAPASQGSVELPEPSPDTCQSDQDCAEMECSHLDNEIKSGYAPMCVDTNKGTKTCKCMCIGCH